jgi:hypothetical protein
MMNGSLLNVHAAFVGKQWKVFFIDTYTIFCTKRLAKGELHYFSFRVTPAD